MNPLRTNFEYSVPAERDAFVGRATVLEQLENIFSDPSVRLVSLLGPPGVGKTRLAQHFALQHRPANTQALFAELTIARTPEELLDAVVRELEAPMLASVKDPVRALARQLTQQGPTLLVCDNAEGLTHEARALLGTLLSYCPDLRVLATTRTALSLRGEHRYNVPPLNEDEALALFLLRAQHTDSAEHKAPKQQDSLRELLRRLDHLPLAIELAAARAHVLPAQEFLARLDSRFELLKATGPETPARHASLHQALELSWSALSETTRRALARCSLCSGSFRLSTLEALSGKQQAPDILQELLEHSLVVRQTALFTQEPRFSLYESIREFAREQLQREGEEALLEAEQLHALHFAQEGERLALASRRPDGANALELLALDADNLSSALERSLPRAPGLAARLGLALDPLAQTRGPLHVHADRLGRVSQALAQQEPTHPLRPRVLASRGYALIFSGVSDEAVPELANAFELARELGDGDTSKEVGALLALVAQWHGDEPTTQSEGLTPHSRMAQGVLFLHRGQLEEALAALEDARSLAREERDHREEGRALSLSAMCTHELGWFDAARRVFEEAKTVLRAAGYEYFLAVTELWHAHLQTDEGAPQSALQRLAVAEATLERCGDAFFLGAARGYRGVNHLLLGEASLALSPLEEATEQARTLEDIYRRGIFCAFYSAALADVGDRPAAERLLQEAEQTAKRGQNPNIPAVCTLLRAHFELTDPRSSKEQRSALLPRHAESVRALQRLLPRSSDVRFALRLLERTCAQHGLDTPWKEAPAAERPLRVGTQYDWFDAGNGRVELARRGALQRIFSALMEAHAKGERRPLGTIELLERGWPGQKMAVDSGVHRVHVAIAELRKMGLGAALQRRHEGYLLNPALHVIRAE